MIKTIIANNEMEFDNLVNAFEKQPDKSVFATQSHITNLGFDSNGNIIIRYTAVIFYKVRL